MIAPAVVLRYVPLVANARMPGRAMVVVYLAVGVLCGIGLSSFSASRQRPVLTYWLLGSLIVVEYLAAPFATTPVECPPIYQVVRDRPEPGALADLPLSLGDGFGELTPVDPQLFICQSVHGRPVVGGALARLPRNVVPSYRADPLVATLLRLSGASERTFPSVVLSSERIAEQLSRDQIKFIVLNRRTASAELRAFVERQLPLRLLADDEVRSVYLVDQSEPTPAFK